MSKKQENSISNRVEHILQHPCIYPIGDLKPVVDTILKEKDVLHILVSQHNTPFYVYNQKALDGAIDRFYTAFQKNLPTFKGYYALKLNHHISIVKRVVERGMGLDVASKREIDIALEAGCNDMLYFAPGKTLDDLEYALKHSDKLSINIDSFSEIERLGLLTNKKKRNIRAGIRIHTDLYGDWKKYGIHLKCLQKAWQEAKKYPYLHLQGIHFHMSRNKDALFYETTIKEVGEYLTNNFTEKERKNITYIDFGGGFETHCSEGFFPKNTPEGSLIKTANDHINKETLFDNPYYVLESMDIKAYAQKIGEAITTYLKPIIDAEYYSEPGRIICNEAMFIVLSVVDVKDKRNVILDGGVNMVGWQRFEHEYFPLVNISAPAREEVECNMWGNLCTTWDIWGYRCYAKQLREGDIIVVPNQGALTYSLEQNFIQPIPPVYTLEN